jgi:hypothetical protein
VLTNTPDADIRLIGTARRAPAAEGWNVEIRLVSRSGADLGSRTITTAAPHCSSLDDSLALAVGLMLDVSKEKLAERAAPTASEPGKPKPASAEPEIRIPKETNAPRAPWRIQPELAAGIALGLLPGPAVSASLGVVLAPPGFWPWFLRGDLWVPKEEAGGGRGSTLSAWTLDAGLCPLGFGTTLALDACILERTGVVRSTGFGFDENRESADIVFDVGVEGRATLAIVGPLQLVARAGVELPLLRYRFFYTTAAEERRSLFRTAPVIGVAHAGLALDL